MKSSVMVLDTRYAIKRMPPNIMPEALGGFCDPDLKEIFVMDLAKAEGWCDEKPEKIAAREREILRHEIVHAFLNESGLKVEARVVSESWAHNEETVDWFAIQGQKIYKAWQEVGCVD